MSQNISTEDYTKFCNQYPQLAKIGSGHIGPKIWIMFNALRDNSVSLTSISHKPCASLMENNVSYEDLKEILSDLRASGLLWYDDKTSSYRLKNDIAYVLQQLSFDLTRKLPSTSDAIILLLRDCGYSSAFTDRRTMVKPLLSDDDNIKNSKFKELISEVAYSGLKLIIKLMNRAGDSID